MKTVSADYLAHIARSYTTVADCYLVTRADGTVFGFTAHDKPLEIAAVTYAADAAFVRSAIKSGSDLSVDNADIEGAFTSSAITAAAVRAGLWDYAEVRHFRVNWADLTQGVEKVRRGWLGNITRGRSQFVAELRGMIQHLAQQIGELVGADCAAELGDARCKVRLDPPAWAALTAYTVRPAREAGEGSVVKPSVYNGRHFKCTTAGTSGAAEPAWNTGIGVTTSDGSAVWTALLALTVQGTITAVTSRLAFADSGRTEADDTFSAGTITFTTGDNAGVAREVKRSLATGALSLQLPMPYDVAVGNAYRMTLGCRYRFSEDCKTTFDNGNNFRGYPHLPGMDYLMSGKQSAA